MRPIWRPKVHLKKKQDATSNTTNHIESHNVVGSTKRTVRSDFRHMQDNAPAHFATTSRFWANKNPFFLLPFSFASHLSPHSSPHLPSLPSPIFSLSFSLSEVNAFSLSLFPDLKSHSHSHSLRSVFVLARLVSVSFHAFIFVLFSLLGCLLFYSVLILCF